MNHRRPILNETEDNLRIDLNALAIEIDATLFLCCEPEEARRAAYICLYKLHRLKEVRKAYSGQKSKYEKVSVILKLGECSHVVIARLQMASPLSIFISSIFFSLTEQFLINVCV